MEAPLFWVPVKRDLSRSIHRLSDWPLSRRSREASIPRSAGLVME